MARQDPALAVPSPLKTSFTIISLLVIVAVVLVFMQFRASSPQDPADDDLRPGRPGDGSGSKVTFNGVEIGRVTDVSPRVQGGVTNAELKLDVNPKYVNLIPANAIAEIKATTVFGNKYVSFRSPPNPSKARISSSQVIDVTHVTTEFNTLFETLTNISEKVDPVKLNLTLAAAADALSGLGTKFGQAILNGNAILDDLNPQMPQIRYDVRRLADLADVYAKASPDFWGSLDNAVTTAQTLNSQRGDLDAALLAAAGFGNTAGDVFERGEPYFVRGQQDLLTTARTLDTYSPAIFCIIRNHALADPAAAAAAGGNGYSIDFHIMLTGAPNPYIYPDNLPRVNAKGGPGGRRGAGRTSPATSGRRRTWWPTPALRSRPTTTSELGQPILNEYVWGRQIGEYTINP